MEQAAKELKPTALAKGKLKRVDILHRLCDGSEVGETDDPQMALRLSEAVLEDLRRSYEKPMYLTEKLAYAKRTGVWKNTGLPPGGAKDKIFNTIVKTSTNPSPDPMDAPAQRLRLGISTGTYRLVLVNRLNDILMGEPELGSDPVGMRVIDPEYVNIMVTSHQHSIFGSLIRTIRHLEIKEMADRVGARDIRIVGCMYVGQGFQARSRCYEKVFCGYAGNSYSNEAVLLVGCTDLVVSGSNRSPPGIEPTCEEFSIPMLCLDDVVEKEEAGHLPYRPEDREDVSVSVTAAAIASYVRCSRAGEWWNPMQNYGCNEAVTGVAERILKGALGGSFVPLTDLIAAGSIKGVATVVGYSSLRTKGYDVLTVELVKKLIARDILMVSTGCTCGGPENRGPMSQDAAGLAGLGLSQVCRSLGIPPVPNFGPCLTISCIEAVARELAGASGVDLPKPPVAVSAPQWLEEQILVSRASTLVLGFHLHLGLAPFVMGNPVILDVLCNQMGGITGGRLMVETGIDAATEKVAVVILDKRRGLGLNE